MYTDYSPVATFPRNKGINGHQVVVVEGGEKAKDVMALARESGLTSRDADGDEIFWVVFASEPQRVWDFTGRALRKTLWTMRTRQSR